MSEKAVVSSRVRLARNYNDLPFDTRRDSKNAGLCIQRACQAFKNTPETYHLRVLREMSELERKELVEEHLVSRDLLKRSETGAALIRADRRVCVMINEEDHLRIQAIVSGFDLNVAAEEAFAADEKLEGICSFSFDPQLGYLTSCPTNTGTGLRASLMLHLPMLTLYKQMGTVNQSVAKLGLTIRGIYGEGSEALGDLYQVSNQVTLGRTEEEIIQAVTAVGKQLTDMELSLRERCRVEASVRLTDTLWRSYGTLLYAVTMDEKELMKHWSQLRLGAAMGLLEVPVSTVDGLLSITQDAHAARYGQSLSEPLPAEQARCILIRQALHSDQ